MAVIALIIGNCPLLFPLMHFGISLVYLWSASECVWMTSDCLGVPPANDRCARTSVLEDLLRYRAVVKRPVVIYILDGIIFSFKKVNIWCGNIINYEI